MNETQHKSPRHGLSVRQEKAKTQNPEKARFTPQQEANSPRDQNVQQFDPAFTSKVLTWTVLGKTQSRLHRTFPRSVEVGTREAKQSTRAFVPRGNKPDPNMCPQSLQFPKVS
jgi:hypothetical protein